MSEASSQSDKLKNQAEMINLAHESVLTEDQAKELINGRIDDAFLVKAKVDIENRIGALLILFSSYKNKILDMYSMFGNSPILRKIRTFEDYQQFSLDFIEVQHAGGVDNSLSEMVGHGLYMDFTSPNIQSFIPAWEKKDVTSTTQFIEQSIMKHLRANRVKVVAEVDKISSIKFRYKNPMQGVVSPITYNPAQEETAEKSDEDLLPYQRQMNDIVRAFSKEINCETMLSPMNGVDFDDLLDNQEILFKLPYSSPQEKAQAQALGAVDSQGKLKPVIGRFISIVHGDGEYHIFAKGPSNTVLHSIEESPVRIATTQKKSVGLDTTAIESGSGNTGPIVIGIIAVICILILMLILF